MKFRLFISSVQKEFAKERRAIASYIRKDAVFGKFFDVFLFEESPAASISAQGVYLKEAVSTAEVTTEVTTEVKWLGVAFGHDLNGSGFISDLLRSIGISDREDFRKRYLRPALESGLVEMTQPNSPRSPTQKYRLTAKGRELLASMSSNGEGTAP